MLKLVWYSTSIDKISVGTVSLNEFLFTILPRTQLNDFARWYGTAIIGDHYKVSDYIIVIYLEPA